MTNKQTINLLYLNEQVVISDSTDKKKTFRDVMDSYEKAPQQESKRQKSNIEILSKVMRVFGGKR